MIMGNKSQYPNTNHLVAEIVETTSVVSRFSDIRKETTSFLVVLGM